MLVASMPHGTPGLGELGGFPERDVTALDKNE
jgi:hypothetical protein